ncbi:hypothetical protein RclHR1_00570012 [Rhizophagus clarus]|uniref:Uncharacterized protein n=1 Tax=Rhizophagus clarus TaxID=94130 RepID=A0A2Z6RNT0_9GLOM|nr:hypothetical protein RclHR1_00570012 [Rhizophagus clarus]GET04222.1 hypothetical protein RCL_e21544_RclHR1_00570012 [Rhizophagus clarus]
MLVCERLRVPKMFGIVVLEYRVTLSKSVPCLILGDNVIRIVFKEYCGNDYSSGKNYSTYYASKKGCQSPM